MKATLCTEHFKKDQLKPALAYDAVIRVWDDDGNEQIWQYSEDLCEPDAAPYRRLMQYIETKKLADQLPDPTPPAPPARKSGPSKEDTPAAPETPDSWECLDCKDGTVYIGQQKGAHARTFHKRKVWEVRWRALFNISDWVHCKSCDYPTRDRGGLRQHQKAAGHTGVRDDELETETGRAMNRAAEARS